MAEILQTAGRQQAILLLLDVYISSAVTTIIIQKLSLSSVLHTDVPGNPHKPRRHSPALSGLIPKVVPSREDRIKILNLLVTR